MLPLTLTKVLKDPHQYLGGTDLKITLPVSRTLLNEVLAARPADVPVNELLIDPEAGNSFNLHLDVKAPLIGSVKRKITFEPGPAVTFPGQPWLHFEITDGFRLLDKPIIKLMQGQIADRLPKGIELTSDHLRLHVPALLTSAGYQTLVPLIKSLRLTSEANALVLNVQFVAEQK